MIKRAKEQFSQKIYFPFYHVIDVIPEMKVEDIKIQKVNWFSKYSCDINAVIKIQFSALESSLLLKRKFWRAYLVKF